MLSKGFQLWRHGCKQPAYSLHIISYVYFQLAGPALPELKYEEIIDVQSKPVKMYCYYSYFHSVYELKIWDTCSN